jgi:ABC-2 type transport system ATP-binding protein
MARLPTGTRAFSLSVHIPFFSGAPMIQVNGLTKDYGARRAIDNLTFDTQQGEIVGFLGPNGAGKTTTIKMLCGLLFPTSGTIRVGGFDMASQGDEARRLIAFVPDTPYLYEKLTGREFLRFIADMYGMAPTHSQKRMDEVIEIFRLGEFIDDLAESYSHGMRQRTVFAAALLHEPKLLITDEPTVGLDPKSIRMLKDLLRQQANLGTTVFLSTHSLDVAQELADRIGIIDRGRLIGCGTLESLRHQADRTGTLEEVFLKLTAEGDDVE